MKPIIPFALLGAFFAVGAAAKAASTTPVGYVTKALPAGQTTLVGLTLHNPVVSAGVLDAEASGSVGDTEANFTALLTAGSTYILELGDGTVQEVTSWSGSTLNTPTDISGLVVPGTTSYTLRKAATVSQIFGAANSVGLGDDSDGSLTGTDFILIPNGVAFDTVYYFDDGAGTTGWFDDQGNPADNRVISYPDGFFVQRAAGSSIDLVISGEVKTVETDGVLVGGYNYLSGVSPAGLTLATSGLEAFLAIDSVGDIETADLVLLQQAGGAYKTCYYFNDGLGTQGWFDDQGNSVDGDSIEGGFLVLNRTGSKPYSVDVPASYSSL